MKRLAAICMMNLWMVSICFSQNVGIGTTTPTNKLSVVGNANVTGRLFIATGTPVLDERLTIKTGTDSFGVIHTDGRVSIGTWIGSYNGADGGWIGTFSRHNLYMFTDNSGALATLDTLGRFGIGVVSPMYNLDVANHFRVAGNAGSYLFNNSNAAVGGAVALAEYTGINATPQIRFSKAGNASYDVGMANGGFFQVEVNNVPVLSVDPGGNTSIGIGEISNPFRRLSVKAGVGTTTAYFENLSGFDPALRVNGLAVFQGSVQKPGGSFKIDHPLDPENKYLYHSFVESPDMMNIYNGNAVTDDKGLVTVTMPDWFQALNMEFRYQLTVMGQFAQAIVAEKIKDNQFVIRTDKPKVEVSWQVTGIRHDAYANKHRIPVEEDKPSKEKGRYFQPDSFGKPASMGIY